MRTKVCVCVCVCVCGGHMIVTLTILLPSIATQVRASETFGKGIILDF